MLPTDLRALGGSRLPPRMLRALEELVAAAERLLQCRRKRRRAFDERWIEDVHATEVGLQTSIARPTDGTDIALHRLAPGGGRAAWLIELDGSVVVSRDPSGVWRVDEPGLAEHLFIAHPPGRHAGAHALRRWHRLAVETRQALDEIVALS